MTLQYASDLHLELPENREYLLQHPLDVTGDILVLAGDTTYLGAELEFAKRSFLKWCSDNYRETYLIPGNHEFYGQFPLDLTLTEFQLDVLPNVHYLNNRSVRLGETELFLTTLWTHIEDAEVYDVERVMNDFRKIRYGAEPLCYALLNQAHAICLNWLREALARSTARQKVVVTHHCPVDDPYVRKYVGGLPYPAYVEDMSALLAEFAPDFWIHGHTHTNCTSGRRVGRTTVLCNSLGYVDDGEHLGYGGAQGFSHRAVIAADSR